MPNDALLFASVYESTVIGYSTGNVRQAFID